MKVTRLCHWHSALVLERDKILGTAQAHALLDSAKRERRYQLLRVATKLRRRAPAGGCWVSREEAVDEAIALLADIERREP